METNEEETIFEVVCCNRKVPRIITHTISLKENGSEELIEYVEHCEECFKNTNLGKHLMKIGRWTPK